MGVSRERIRQVEEQALLELSKHPKAYLLKDYL